MTKLNEKKLTIGDIVNFKRGYDLPHRDRVAGNIPIMSSSGLTGWHNEFKVKAPGVVTGRYGTLGEVFYSKDDYWPLNTSLYVQDFKGNNPRFIYYYLKTVLSENFNSAGAVPGVNRNYLHKIKVPDLPDGRDKIAAILTSYDDLILNNKRRIELLEQMAVNIFKEWFVRFRFPNHESTEFDKGLPKNWETKKFRDIVSYYIGGGWGEDSATPTYSDKAYVIRGTDIPKLALGELSEKILRYHKPSNLKSRKLEENDFVFEVSGGSKDQLLGRNLMVSRGLLNFFENNVMCASFCKQIRFNSEQVSPFFMKYFLKLYYECDLVGIYQVQSTGISNYQFESFLNFQTITLPDSDTLVKFEKLVKPIIEQQEKLALENLNLEKTKSMLLPRLISGKLSVEKLDIKFPLSMQEVKE